MSLIFYYLYCHYILYSFVLNSDFITDARVLIDFYIIYYLYIVILVIWFKSCDINIHTAMFYTPTSRKRQKRLNVSVCKQVILQNKNPTYIHTCRCLSSERTLDAVLRVVTRRFDLLRYISNRSDLYMIRQYHVVLWFVIGLISPRPA